MSRTTFGMLLACLLLPLVALLVRASGWLEIPPAPVPRNPRLPTPPPVSASENPRSGFHPEKVPPPAKVVDQSSWEAPFRTDLWTHSGWEFSKQGMATTGSQRAWATFSRPYQHLMLECGWQLPQATAPDFEITLSPAEARTQIRIVLSHDQLRLVQQQGEQSTELKARPCQPTSQTTDPRVLRVVITGTRLLIHWQGRIWITAEQPQALQGRLFHWTLVSSTPQLRITNLRVEGE